MTRSELDRQYSPSSVAPDFEEVLAEYRVRSDEAHSTFSVREVAYGNHSQERLDLFPARDSPAPLVVYVHGGHWQEGGREYGAFCARSFLEAGFAYAAVGYGLAPARTLTDMIESTRKALRWLSTHAAEAGSRSDWLYAVGSSAGAHLLAAALSEPDTDTDESPPLLLAGATLLSGTYDLEPIVRTYVNDALGLDTLMARKLSPVHRLPLAAQRLIIARGSAETQEYERQHDLVIAALTAAGQPFENQVVAGRNHFNVVFDLADPGTVLGAIVRCHLDQVRGTEPPSP